MFRNLCQHRRKALATLLCATLLFVLSSAVLRGSESLPGWARGLLGLAMLLGAAGQVAALLALARGRR